MVCPVCGIELENGTLLCSACGASIAVTASPVKSSHKLATTKDLTLILVVIFALPAIFILGIFALSYLQEFSSVEIWRFGFIVFLMALGAALVAWFMFHNGKGEAKQKAKRKSKPVKYVTQGSLLSIAVVGILFCVSNLIDFNLFPNGLNNMYARIIAVVFIAAMILFYVIASKRKTTRATVVIPRHVTKKELYCTILGYIAVLVLSEILNANFLGPIWEAHPVIKIIVTVAIFTVIPAALVLWIVLKNKKAQQ